MTFSLWQASARILKKRDVVVVCGGATTATLVTWLSPSRYTVTDDQQQPSTNYTRCERAWYSSRATDSKELGDTTTEHNWSQPQQQPLLPSRTDLVKQLYLSGSGNNDDNNGDDFVFDVLVIGGGATGAGIALDAASRGGGLRVACIDRHDFASETSSRSTKLLWAGIRYLATAAAHVLNQPLSAWLTRPSAIIEHFVGEFQMVRACHVERRHMLDKQRHLCHWMPIAVPFTSYVRVGLRHNQPPPFGNSFFQFFPALAPAVFLFYDALSGFTVPSSYVIGAQRAAATILPHLRLYDNSDDETTDRPKPFVRYLSVFGEGMHNDARTCLAIVQSAIAHGAVVCNHVEAMELIPRQAVDEVTGQLAPQRHGPPLGVKVRDKMTGESFAVHAAQIVLAGGPFTDELRSWTEPSNEDPAAAAAVAPSETVRAIRESAGTHIVLRGGIVPPNMGLLDFNTSDGRFLFVLPWLGHTLVGTTDDPSTRTQSRHDPPETDIDYLLRECQTYLQLEQPLQRSDVLSAWRGWRPLAVDPHAPPNAPVSRDHVISRHPDTGIFFIAGGKWTTWREMAHEVVDRVLAVRHADFFAPDAMPPQEALWTKPIGPCRTLDIVLHGGDENFDATKLVAQFQERHAQLDVDVVQHLVDTYGIHVWDVAALWETESAAAKSSPTTTTLQKRLVPGFPYLEAEVVYACQREYACTIADVLSRRTRLSYLNKQAALSALPRVAQLMAESLQWNAKARQQQIAAAHEELSSFGGAAAPNDTKTLP
jgi:glycerol-3-phosphate dehydrogenase